MERMYCITDEKNSKCGQRVMKARAMGVVSSTRQLPGCVVRSSSVPAAADDDDDDKAAKPVRSRRGYNRQMPYLTGKSLLEGVTSEGVCLMEGGVLNRGVS